MNVKRRKQNKKTNNEIYLVMLHLCIANIQIAIRNEHFYRFSDENTEKKTRRHRDKILKCLQQI